MSCGWTARSDVRWMDLGRISGDWTARVEMFVQSVGRGREWCYSSIGDKNDTFVVYIANASSAYSRGRWGNFDTKLRTSRWTGQNATVSADLGQKQHHEMDETEYDDNSGVDATMNVASPQFFAAQVSTAEYEKQKKSYTALAVDALTHSAEYQRKFTMCQLCWCSWSLGEASQDCLECGGNTLTRPCPVCDGRCNSTWHRDVEMSHSQHFAHWDGSCCLPEEEKSNFMLLALIDDMSEDDIVSDMGDLTTS
ncbi:hypothetical protein LSAT2_024213 [Lamellibrachia satsuma]|nr:hypothetical protein LSAT2_024213 [Lamellibrachia satsuma]